MKDIRIGHALKVGWKKFAERPWYLLGISLSVMVLFAVSIGNAMVTAVAYILYGGYILSLINHYRGEKIVFDDLFSLDSRWIYFVFLGMVKGILILLGFLCFIIPGIYLSIRWMFAEMFVLDKGMRPMEALKASSKLTEGYRGHLFLYAIAVTILLIIGVFFLIIGAVVVSIFTLLSSIYLYEKLRAIKEM